jgi:hypothetical protein
MKGLQPKLADNSPDSIRRWFMRRAEKKLQKLFREQAKFCCPSAESIEIICNAEFYGIRHLLRKYEQGYLAWQHWRGEKDEYTYQQVIQVLRENIAWRDAHPEWKPKPLTMADIEEAWYALFEARVK